MKRETKKENKKTKLIVEVFDSMFIMILCFVTLLSAMLMQGNAGVLTYLIDFKTLLITIGGLVIYLTFVLRQSDKGLKKMIEHNYSNKENSEHLPIEEINEVTKR